VGRRLAAAITALAAAKLAAFLVWAAFHDEYDGVVIDTGVAMGAILLLQLVARVRRRARSAPWIAAGILVSVAAAAIEAAGVSPGGPFTHDDLYHLVQIGGVLLLYRGALRLETQVPG
jgi:peptidoglycan/LPS O-acetylase OafA/YrhL